MTRFNTDEQAGGHDIQIDWSDGQDNTAMCIRDIDGEILTITTDEIIIQAMSNQQAIIEKQREALGEIKRASGESQLQWHIAERALQNE